MLQDFRILFRYYDLLRVWTVRDIRVRYKQSFLGVAWAILQPLIIMVVFTVIFSLIVRITTDPIPYPIFSYTAVLPWTFLATSITMAVPSLVNNMNLVSKIYFPREILPLAAIAASFVDFLVASVVFVGLMFFFRMQFHTTLIAVPLLLLVQLLLTVGVALLGAAAMVFYRDIRFVIPLGLQIWMYITPIIYPITMVPESLRTFYYLNPMVGLIQSYRSVMLLGEWPDWPTLGLSAAVSITVFLGGYFFFKRVEWQFADII